MANQKKSNNSVLWVILAASILLLFSYRSTFWSQGVAPIYSVITYPLLRFQSSIVAPCARWIDRFFAHAQSADTIVVLQQENDNLRARLIELQAQENMYSEIRELVEYRKQFDDMHGRIVSILSKVVSDREHYVMIDRGEKHGIKTDMVAVYKNCLLGKVTKVFPLTSKVTLLTDKSCKVAAYCASTKASGIHVGAQGNMTELQRVNHLADIKESDLVLSSGEGLVFPQGYALGYVDSVGFDGIYKLVSVKPCIDITAIQYCTIVQKSEAPSQVPLPCT